jgi:CheY-like chemotaxis protein
MAGSFAHRRDGPVSNLRTTVNALTILIVDDDPDMRTYLRGCLRGLGDAAGAVIDAADGIEALWCSRGWMVLGCARPFAETRCMRISQSSSSAASPKPRRRPDLTMPFCQSRSTPANC